MKNKKFYVGSAIMLILLGTSVLSVAAVIKNRIPKTFETAKSQGLNDALFERDGGIYSFDYDSGEIRLLADGGKYSPCLSPDRTKILYRKSVLETGDDLIVGLLDQAGTPLGEIKLETICGNDIINYYWLSDTTIGVELHVNPSTSEFVVYDIENKKELCHYAGYSFTPIPETGKMMYVKNVPHWSEESICHSFVIGEEIVYTSDVPDARLGTPVFSEDGKKIVFTEDYEGRQSVVLADFDSETMKISGMEKTALESGVTGYLAFDPDDKLCIINDSICYRIDSTSGRFKGEEIDTDLRNAATDSQKYPELQKAVSEYWGENSLENIHTITWVRDVF